LQVHGETNYATHDREHRHTVEVKAEAMTIPTRDTNVVSANSHMKDFNISPTFERARFSVFV